MGGRGSSSGKGGASGKVSNINQNNLPQLNGTEKQVSFANDIRQRQVEKYNQQLKQFSNITNMQEIREYEKTFDTAYLAGVPIEIRKQTREKLQKIQDDFSNERASIASQIKAENKRIRREDAFDMAEKRISSKYVKKYRNAMQPLINATADKIQKIESAKWWIESGRRNSFK